jgi:hypothetical protein
MHPSRQEETRHDIYAALLGLDWRDPKGLLEFQFRLAKAIIGAESDGPESGGFKRHAFLLRRCQDSLAFRLLVPHAIRQLLGTASPRAHWVKGQGQSFKIVQETANRYAADGHLVLLTDLSNIIRVGDLVVCDNAAVPSVIEVKAGKLAPKHATQGRRGRQSSRSLSTIEYLATDHAHIFGQSVPKLAVQSKQEMQFSWRAVNEVAMRALREGMATARISKYDVIHAVHAVDGRPVSGAPLVEDIKRMRSPCLASHAVGLLNPEILTLPPLVWPIEEEPKSPLMEERLVIGHLIDLARFKDPLEDDFRVLNVSLDSGLSTDRDGEKGTASVRFIDNVLFGYATIESTVAALREMHDLTRSELHGWAEEPPQPSPIASAVEDRRLDLCEQPAVILETRDARFRIARPCHNASDTPPASSEDPGPS